ncbi:MAG: type II toxin-antitoxin system VapC family toxin [Bradymonadales bacterium]|nr:type II toxin-antitoxin system VapC family toxin [Bradymonadales bacterium]
MRLLLDTHILLWSLGAPERLPSALREAIESPENEVFVSAASLWEIAIKQTSGRVDLVVQPDEILAVLPEVGFQELPVRAVHAVGVAHLPPLHRDPFDRLLVAQALAEPLVLVTRDRMLSGYPVQLWMVN